MLARADIGLPLGKTFDVSGSGNVVGLNRGQHLPGVGEGHLGVRAARGRGSWPFSQPATAGGGQGWNQYYNTVS